MGTDEFLKSTDEYKQAVAEMQVTANQPTAQGPAATTTRQGQTQAQTSSIDASSVMQLEKSDLMMWMQVLKLVVLVAILYYTLQD